MVVVAAALAAATTATSLFSASAANTTSPRHHVVDIAKFKFSPANLTIRQGDTVEWINRDIVPHTATEKGKAWDTEKLGRRNSARITFSVAGTVAYFCRYHPGMRAEITVTAK